MKYDPNKYHRHSIRLRGYDYTQAGAYFVTICTQNRQCLFGEIVDQTLHLNHAGQMVETWFAKLPTKFTGIDIDLFVTMPNHFHGIIVITKSDYQTGLSQIVQWFKTMTTNDYIRGVKCKGWTPFQKKLWQRNYYEHIIRNEESLQILREYIVNNPASWQQDTLHPKNVSDD